MTDTMKLPQGYEDLVAMAARWARPTEAERSEVRWTAAAEDFAQLYEAIMPRLDAILADLAKLPLDGMDEAQSNLFCLAAAFAEASPHHELYKGSPDVPFSFSAKRFVPGHGGTPSWSPTFR